METIDLIIDIISFLLYGYIIKLIYDKSVISKSKYIYYFFILIFIVIIIRKIYSYFI